jgi:PhzF family phenazine biosynthesis protein
MKLTLYQVDAFTGKLFGGNPAAVVPLTEWISDQLMQQIAMENNLSDTAFFVPSATPSADYEIRWFTPATEINLCGHATLATSYVLYNRMGFTKPAIRFQSPSGLLTIVKEGDRYNMDFPAWTPTPLPEYPAALTAAMGEIPVKAVYKYRDFLVEVATEQEVQHYQPDLTLLKKLGEKVILTAKGESADFVSRFFAPVAGIDEDPVTGSAHAQLVPYWAAKLGKNDLHARQLSPRGGELWCQYQGERVTIAGQCVFYMQGEIEL